MLESVLAVLLNSARALMLHVQLLYCQASCAAALSSFELLLINVVQNTATLRAADSCMVCIVIMILCVSTHTLCVCSCL
jgi:hypothetical protein